MDENLEYIKELNKKLDRACKDEDYRLQLIKELKIDGIKVNHTCKESKNKIKAFYAKSNGVYCNYCNEKIN